jgi:hypothetical protein
MMKLQHFDFIIKHVLSMTNICTDALSHLDRQEKNLPKVRVVLPERVFVRALAGKEEMDPLAELSDKEKSRRIARYHNSPIAGHPGVKRTLYLIH